MKAAFAEDPDDGIERLVDIELTRTSARRGGSEGLGGHAAILEPIISKVVCRGFAGNGLFNRWESMSRSFPGHDAFVALH